MGSTSSKPLAHRNRQRRDWDLAAPGWGAWHARTIKGGSALTERLLSLARIRPGQRVLDIACGAGDPAFSLAERVGPDGAVLGLDLSPEMVRQARAGAAARGLANTEFRVIEDELNLGVPAGDFDAATCRFGLMLMAVPSLALAEIRLALKPGGRIVVCTWGPPERVPYFATVQQLVRRHVDLPPPDPMAPGPMSLPTPEALRAIFQSAGFTTIETEVMQATALEAEGPDVFWDTAASISGPLVAVLGSLPLDRRNAIRDDAIQTLRVMFPEGPIRLGGEVVIAAGMNPG